VDDTDLRWGDVETGNFGWRFHGTDDAVGGDSVTDHVFVEGRDGSCDADFGSGTGCQGGYGACCGDAANGV